MTTPTTVLVQLKVRSDTAANWTSANPTLLANELGRETDTGRIKIGTGSTAWTALPYQPFGALITNADISATAEIAVSKLADGAARQLLQTDAASTGVEWTSNVDIPGTLDVTGAATFDAAVTVAGDLTVNGTTTTISTQNLLVEDKNIIIGDVASPTDVTADGGGITLKGATDKTINWVDATDAWTSSERFSVPLGTAALPSLTFTGDPNTGIYSPGADQVAISTGGSGRLFINSNGDVGVGTGGTQGTKLHAVGGNIWSGNFYEVGRFQKSSGTAISLGYDNSDYVATVGAYSHDGTPSNLSFWTYPGSGAVQERLRITSAGLVGVGTSSPSSIMHLATGTGVSSELRFSNPANNWSVKTGTSGNSFSIVENQFGGTALFVDSALRVGVGTTSPGSTLDINGDCAVANTKAYQVKDSGGTTRYAMYMSGSLSPSAGNDLFIGNTLANSLVLYTNSAERARIDSSGRVGIGTSSPVATNHIRGSGTSGQVTASWMLENASSGTVGMDVTGAAGSSIWRFLYGGGPSTGTNALTPALTIGVEGSAAGKVGIGTTSVQQALHVSQSGGNNFAGIRSQNSNTGTGIAGIEFSSDATYAKAAIGLVRGDANGVGSLVFYNASSTGAADWSTSDEKMRITANSDNLCLLGQSTNPATSTLCIAVRTGTANGVNAQITSNTGTSFPWSNYNASGTYVGGISCTSTATSFPTSSDYRLKTNVQPLAGAISLVSQLKPSTFEFNENPGETVQGFIAHELQEVVPLAVIGEKDAEDAKGNPVYQGVDTAKLVPLLTAALQEAVAKIESLEARLTAAGI